MPKKLGFGCMRLPSVSDGVVDIELTKKMVDAFIENGYTYFDTAWMYCNGKSEEIMKETLVMRHPRESFTLTTKLPSYMVKCEDDRDKMINEQLRRTGAGYFDYYLIHDVNNKSIETFEKFKCFEWVKQKKAEGVVKNIGFSFHGTYDLFERLILEHHKDLDVVQLQLNYLDWEDKDVAARKCYELATKYGIKVLVMEPVRGGKLANVPAEVEAMFKESEPEMSAASWAIRFAAGFENIYMVLSGMSNMEQLLDNMNTIDNFRPLTEEQYAIINKAADIINEVAEIPCTGCSYCTVDCPAGIAIPQYFALYNKDVREGRGSASEGYASEKAKGGAPSDCVECGQCENMCPQHLEIRGLLKTVKARFE